MTWETTPTEQPDTVPAKAPEPPTAVPTALSGRLPNRPLRTIETAPNQSFQDSGTCTDPPRRESKGTCTSPPEKTSRGNSPEPAPVLTSTASGPEEEHLGHLAFSFLPSEDEMEEMGQHLDLRLKEIQEMEPENRGDEIFEETKDDYNFDLHIYESLVIRIKDETTRRTEAFKKTLEEEVEEKEEHRSPSNQPPQKKNKRSRNKKKAAAWRT